MRRAEYPRRRTMPPRGIVLAVLIVVLAASIIGALGQ